MTVRIADAASMHALISILLGTYRPIKGFWMMGACRLLVYKIATRV